MASESTGMTITLAPYAGGLALVGPGVEAIANEALSKLKLKPKSFVLKQEATYHVTLATKAELRNIPEDRLARLHADTTHIHSLGIGGKGPVYYVVIIWAAGQQLRKQLGLSPKHFHITLSAKDDHEMDKGVKSLLHSQFPSNPSPDLLDHLVFTLQAFGEYQRAQKYARDLILTLPKSHRGFLRMGDAALRGAVYKLAMLSYACAHDRSDDAKIQQYCIKKMIECSQYTEWGSTMLHEEIEQIPTGISCFLLDPWSNDLRTALSEQNLTPTLQLATREQLFIPLPIASQPYFKLPRFFRWLVPYHIALMSTPRREEDIMALASLHLGIRHVLTLTKETPLDAAWFKGKRITNTYLPIPNYQPPTIEQMDIIMRLFDDATKLPILIHCGGGKGRVGTVAACYLAAFGFQKPQPNQTQPEMAAADAIAGLRQLRPGSLETSQQEDFVSKWCSTIWKRQSVYPDLPSEPPPCPLVIEGELGKSKENDLFVLVGLPGSGKSWFRKSLIARDPKGWEVISQDESGSRASCETAIGRTPQANRRVLLDRCNTAATDRKGWLQLAGNWCQAPVCIWFDYDRELCTSRAQMRAGHPTLPPGGRVRAAIDHMQKVFVRPTLAEGFRAVVIVRSVVAANELVLRLSPSLQIYKFPRTPHLLNLGAASEDDIVTEAAALPSQGQVVITEKIDGANMGFSLSADRTRIVVQNRSHYVDSSTHEQFKKLGLWVETHREDLYHILDRDPFFAERYMLFGEWMYATHSIPYTNLPDRFIAFDVYDRSTGLWADRQTTSALLEPTSIPLVPVMYTGPSRTDAELRDMVQLPSKFYDGRVEGIYVKVENNGYVVARGKVVRSDFIAGNEHWSKGIIRTNGLARDDS